MGERRDEDHDSEDEQQGQNVPANEEAETREDRPGQKHHDDREQEPPGPPVIPLPGLRMQTRRRDGNQRGDEEQRGQNQDLGGLGLDGDIQQDERGDGRRRERYPRLLVPEDNITGQDESPYV